MRPRPANREPFIRSILLRPEEVPDWEAFPFCLPSIRKLTRLPFHPAVTFLVGENGSGKSTILEAIAVRLDFHETGGEARANFGRRPIDGGLHDAILVESSIHRRPADRFFMRADTMYEFANFIDREVEQDRRILRNYGSRSLHQRSHGEAFLDIVQNRLRSESFFILDEPEAALSPVRQLTVLKEIDWLVREGCQFIIATHSPILMAYPDSSMYVLSDDGIQPTTFEETEHYKLTKAFLDAPEVFLRHLLE